MATEFYWSAKQGCFLNKKTGVPANLENFKFTGTVREWYETLTETIVDAANELHREAAKGTETGVTQVQVFALITPQIAEILNETLLCKFDNKKQRGLLLISK